MPDIGISSGYRIEKLVAVVFIGCLTIMFLSSFDIIKSKIRDVKRRADIKILTKALDLYHDKYGKYPDSVNDWQGWDLSISYNGSNVEFINQLKEEGLIDKTTKDPINDATYHYRYKKFKAGDYGCENAFYILQVNNFGLQNKNNGKGSCPDFDWVESAPNGYTMQEFD
ncbi:MAG: hypothetical protein WC349_03935 [Patescibacteria group bacterium]|jgi:hypothetical protein